MTGVIYQYTSPRGKVYVGQTSNENKRRSQFFDTSQPYAGKKMEAERKKYPHLSNWKYKVLQTIKEDNQDLFKEKLTFLEAYYIIQCNSIQDGLNVSLADMETICTNRYLKKQYMESDDYSKSIILNNIEPNQFCKQEDHYSATAHINDLFWMKEINQRRIIILNMLSQYDTKEICRYVKAVKKIQSTPDTKKHYEKKDIIEGNRKLISYDEEYFDSLLNEKNSPEPDSMFYTQENNNDNPNNGLRSFNMVKKY